VNVHVKAGSTHNQISYYQGKLEKCHHPSAALRQEQYLFFIFHSLTGNKSDETCNAGEHESTKGYQTPIQLSCLYNALQNALNLHFKILFTDGVNTKVFYAL
jgi:hypothetical protein